MAKHLNEPSLSNLGSHAGLREWKPRKGRTLLAAMLLGLGFVPAAMGQAKPESRKVPLSPAESLSRFQLPADLKIDEVLAEPEIAQPVFVNFDERGRLWVVEYRQYPEPAGLKMLSRDNVWRVVYDKVPVAPPNHEKGLDRITIHEDSDGDGTFDKHKVFLEGLNIATACVRGRGGVWVLNAPYFLFYPDKDNDDVPDGDPEVLLEGFGLEDTHSVVNSLCWGPDGWLYAAQGSTVTGRVKRPGSKDAPVHSMGQLIWRFHPETKKYEVFAEGGGNAFGVEIDAKGRIFSGHNGGDTRGFHYPQGGYSRKGFDKHGPLSNPYTFGYFDAMKNNATPRFTHTFVIYEADALPDAYRGRLFGVAPILSHVVMSDVFAAGSTFETKDVGFAIKTTDDWFRPVDIELGPDGALYVADWYDGQTNHYRNHEGQIDRSNGRVYRLRGLEPKPYKPFDLAKASTPELIERLKHPNRWQRQTALRLLGDRKDSAAIGPLTAIVRDSKGQTALEALWALNLSGGLTGPLSIEFLRHEDPYVRLWTARLLCDGKAASPEAAKALAALAEIEPNVEVRAQLASSARRLPASASLPIVRNLLAHSVDAKDLFIPLLLWWDIEAKAESDRSAVVDLFRDKGFWSLPIVKETIDERVMRRYAATGLGKDLATCAELLKLAPDADSGKRLAAGFESALEGRSAGNLPESLVEGLARFQGGSVTLGLRQGRAEAVSEVLRVLDDERADKSKQLQYVQILGEVSQPRSIPALLKLARGSDSALQGAAMRALRRYPNPEIGSTVLAAIPLMTDDVRGEAFNLLASRPLWARGLVEAADAKTIDPASVPGETIARLHRLKDAHVAAMSRKLWGEPKATTSAALQAEIVRLAGLIRKDPGNPREGEKLFAKTCGACHAMFGSGGRVGPELTTFRRDDLDNMLLNIVNPNAEIREGYGTLLVSTNDGQSLTGVLMDQDPGRVVIRGSDGHDLAIPRDEIEEMKASPSSLMPEGLLQSLSAKQVVDLFAYLRATQPPK